MDAIDLYNKSAWTDEDASKVDNLKKETISEIFDIPEENVRIYETERLPAFKVTVEKDRELKGVRNPLSFFNKIDFNLMEDQINENDKRELLFERRNKL